MPSARPSTAMRPATPLSPRYDGSSRCYDGLPTPRQPVYAPRSPSAAQKRRQFGNSLTLPGLPRFHPANYPSSSSSSSHSSFANTPNSGPNSPHAPTSPGMQQKLYIETQRQILARTPSSQFPQRPDSPRLQPLGSPGPVTPLELEADEGYLTVAKSPSRLTALDQPEELANRLSQVARQPKSPRVNSSTLRRQ